MRKDIKTTTNGCGSSGKAVPVADKFGKRNDLLMSSQERLPTGSPQPPPPSVFFFPQLSTPQELHQQLAKVGP